MAIVYRPSCEFHGEKFSSSQAEALTGLQFANKNEQSETGKIGRYRNLPIPYGAASLRPNSEQLKHPDGGLTSLLQVLKEHLKAIMDCGASDVRISLAVYYYTQCNFSFEPHVISLINDMRLSVWISCYEVDEADFVSMGGVA